ncbi:MAG: ATP-binding cassette domain-containing protein [Bacteroidota bacterium]|nr:ATP-binding cassette domain-containing protein [Bacteroidota bacterium]
MLKAEHLRKQFATVLAVEDASLEVKRGSIFGLIGPNGAGKSTIIRMLLHITTPDRGTVTYDGETFNDVIRNKIGYLPEERGLYKKNGLLDTIVYFATLRGISAEEAKKKGMAWLERFDLQKYAKRKIEELSKGNQQKAQFITTILHDPELIILDEPFSGLDPVNQIVMKNVFQELKQQGKAVIFSTHQMDSAEKLSDEICLINKGNIVLEGSLKSVKQKFGSNSLHLEYSGDGKFLSSLPFVKKGMVYENYAELVIEDGIHPNEILQAVTSKIELRKFEFVEPSLNSIFLDVVGVPSDIIEQEEAAHAGVQLQQKFSFKHPKVRKALISLVIALAVTFTLLIVNLKKPHPDWTIVGVFAAATVYSLFQFIKEKKNAERSMASQETDHE